jgi:hypothetical protein
VIAVCHTDNGKDPRLSSLFVSPSWV